MPRIFKAILGLLAIAAAGINPAGATRGAVVRRNDRTEPLPTYPVWAVNETYFNSLTSPVAITLHHPQEKYTKAERARYRRLNAAINELDNRRNDYIRREHAQHEYYLGAYTFLQLKQMIMEEVEDQSLWEEEKEFAQLMYCLHYQAYLELMKPETKLEMGIDSVLPALQRTWIQQYERSITQDKILTAQKKQAKSRFDPSDPINRRAIDKIKARFNATLTTQERGTQFLGIRQIRYDKAKIQDKNVIKTPGYYFNPNVLINVVREIKGLPFQYEFQQLFFAMARISDPELQEYFTDEAIVAAQFTAVSIKSETDFSSEQYYFNNIMALYWRQERLNAAVQNTELTLPELLLMMDKTPAPVRDMYIHAITLKIMDGFARDYPHATLQEKKDGLSQFIKAIPGVSDEIYRACIMAFIKNTSKERGDFTGEIILGILGASSLLSYWYWRHTTAAPQPQENKVEVPEEAAAKPSVHNFVKIGQPKKDQSKNQHRGSSSSSSSSSSSMATGSETINKMIEGKEAIIQRNKEDAKAQKQRENQLAELKNEFIKLVSVIHPYKRKDGDAVKIYENTVNTYKNSTDMEWFSKNKLSKFNEFISQLKAAFKVSKNLGCDPHDNKILDALNYAMKVDNLASTHGSIANSQDNLPSSKSHVLLSVEPGGAGSGGVFVELISDDYLGSNPYTDDPNDTQEITLLPSSASNATTSMVANSYQQQVNRKEILNVAPYLNAMDSDTPSVVLRHAYKLLVIKFHETWKHRLARTHVGDYFTKLRNQLAHNAIEITDNLHTNLYAVLITIENLQRDATSLQDWAAASDILKDTLPIETDRPAPVLQDEFKRLQQELIIVYQAAEKRKDGYDNFRLAFISIFADLGEICSKKEMRNATGQLGQDVIQALKTMAHFRHNEYHSKDLNAVPDEVQNQYVVLLNHFVPQGVSVKLGAASQLNPK